MKKKDKGDNSSQKPIKLTGNPTKGIVNFKPTIGSDDPTRYVGQTQAASTLTPHSSDKNDSNSTIVEQRRYDAHKLDLLLKAGLTKDKDYAQCKKALENPELAKRYPVLREHSFDILYKLIDIITSDATVYNRTKLQIQKKYNYGLAESHVQESEKVTLVRRVLNKRKKCQ